ncbi:MAG: hypothetical protein Q8R92_05210 [Deltaproteobacteria bacterium]|nr:hypothetical protein [Deltaproteobacteria bacterium]
MITSTKVKSTLLLRIDLDAKTCRRYSGRTETHGFVFDEEAKITPQLVEAMRAYPDTVGVEQEKEVA